jgi:hypothetical protein
MLKLDMIQGGNPFGIPNQQNLTDENGYLITGWC